MRRILRSVWIVAGLLFTLWICIGYTAVGDAGDAEGGIRGVSTPYGFEFQPNGPAQAASLIFLPGGMVDPEAYAPLLRNVARAGYPAHLSSLPLRLAFTESQVSELFDHIDALLASDPRRNWVVAGHSRGGMLSARFVHQRRPALRGLVLIGTTHPRDFSLADSTVPVTKVYGTRDEVASYTAMRQNRHLLPASARWVAIEGGNHVQFGYYRHQLGDGTAQITREEQQRQLVNALVDVLSGAAKH